MRSSYAIPRGAVLLKTPNARQQAGRRRAAVACAILALALASGLLGALVHPNPSLSSRPATGPFSYFPSE
jgi:ferric-dicitrate binding protein FerR (iron transport regulator)